MEIQAYCSLATVLAAREKPNLDEARNALMAAIEIATRIEAMPCLASARRGVLALLDAPEQAAGTRMLNA